MKPVAKLIGADGNIFKLAVLTYDKSTLLGIASKALEREGLSDESSEMFDRVFKSSSYEEALSIIMEYVEVE